MHKSKLTDTATTCIYEQAYGNLIGFKSDPLDVNESRTCVISLRLRQMMSVAASHFKVHFYMLSWICNCHLISTLYMLCDFYLMSSIAQMEDKKWCFKRWIRWQIKYCYFGRRVRSKRKCVCVCVIGGWGGGGGGVNLHVVYVCTVRQHLWHPLILHRNSNNRSATRFLIISSVILDDVMMPLKVLRGHWRTEKLERKHVYIFVNLVSADGLAPTSPRTPAGTVISKFEPRIYLWNRHLNVWYHNSGRAQDNLPISVVAHVTSEQVSTFSMWLAISGCLSLRIVSAVHILVKGMAEALCLHAPNEWDLKSFCLVRGLGA